MMVIARNARFKGLDPERAVAAVMVEVMSRRALASLEGVRRAANRLREARGRTGARRAALAAESDPRARTRLAREVARAWTAHVVAGTELAKALRAADADYEQWQAVLDDWKPSLGPVRIVTEPEASLIVFDLAYLEDVRASEAQFRAEMRAFEIPPMPRFAEAPKPEKHGPFKVLQRTDGCWLVVDERRPLAARTVAEVGRNLVDANDHARRLFEREANTGGA